MMTPSARHPRTSLHCCCCCGGGCVFHRPTFALLPSSSRLHKFKARFSKPLTAILLPTAQLLYVVRGKKGHEEEARRSRRNSGEGTSRSLVLLYCTVWRAERAPLPVRLKYSMYREESRTKTTTNSAHGGGCRLVVSNTRTMS